MISPSISATVFARVSALAIMAGLGLAMALPASAQTPPAAQATAAAPDKVLAKVDGAAITQRDVDLAVEDLGERLPRGLEGDQRRDYVVGFLIDLKLGARAADAAKLADSPEFKSRLSYFREKVLMDEFLTRESKKNVTPEAARKLYDETTKTMSPEAEVRARHILVEEEAEAKVAYERVTKGKEDFAKVAADLSRDPGSKTDGGDLGWFSKERMVQTFAEAAFKLDAGQISEPVKTQFGWHVIKLEEKRLKPLPTFESVQKDIENYLVREGQQKVILSLREKAKIERMDKPEEPKKP
jgi:peptidyl-prolyl cis-trans isomerase C